MKCRNCNKEIEKDLKPIIAMAAICRQYNPNHLCKQCRKLNNLMKRKLKEWYPENSQSYKKNE